MRATLKNHHQSPRKVRLVVDLIRGKSVSSAREALRFLSKKSSPAVSKLLNSAVASAESAGHTSEGLFVKTVTVDKGSVMRRYRPFARGRAGTVRKIRSIIYIELGTTGKKAQGTRHKAQGKKQKPLASVSPSA
ncbi:MAG: 50S ribosomal protein L22 [Candidatus Kaiserbacteria bacterium GW2011_GWC2_49_12]|uniref:Large ribosomal subunit protein uL22 n=5 Tax=Candidatus Kaiseribacteriota TaxID=1752734 RepID=A0A0G1YMK2_9BACT|nr:MAG: 50S ribosomal protein L22 [Candidatus Kaiserbacteria bacterium GW2011_GWC2_49_12]KKW08281.1 MAG: 50S ribosomal protein L22 [Candidatus Kaiserbacteria bacterium GW2011_GWA2_49_56]KKW16202.1 MAG: 50S ribosomal protein L22 [Candidatus Kaiserbacteria bacterium GW2011_GWB1_50_17]KKW17300.1 MAG: 50S ribosomal protein L22 [Candidatus Kaiserbacteria bacterium GW2011_GWA1_50_28]OGG87868.1 MAG: 50S ribosomal protein L22 [Candidatus Kaiserbacteria bacterium RIFCSPLOWO2_12_FULL_50_28]HCM43368.1 50